MNGEALNQWLEAFWHGVPVSVLLVSSLLCVSLIYVSWASYRMFEAERRQLGVRKHRVQDAVRLLGYGIPVGLALSVLVLTFGVVLDLVTIAALWLVVTVLYVIYPSRANIAYAAAIVGGLALLARSIPPYAGDTIRVLDSFIGSVQTALQAVSVPSLLFLAAFVYVGQAWLIRWKGSSVSSPRYQQSKRGRLIGVQCLQAFWLLPFIVFVPLESTFSWQSGPASASIVRIGEWWPLWMDGQALIPIFFPVLANFRSAAYSRTPEQKARQLSRYALVGAIVVFAFGVGATLLPGWSLFILIVGLACIVLFQEVGAFVEQRQERKKPPIYVHAVDGLTVLDILPRSPAEKMGLQRGEVITQVNGIPVCHSQDLYAALAHNLTYCTLRVRNKHGQEKFAKTSIYEDDHHQLGIVLAPDDHSVYDRARGAIWHAALARSADARSTDA